MKKKRNFHLKSKHMLVIMVIICIGLLITTFAADFSAQPLRDGAGYVVIPFEKSMNAIGNGINGLFDNFKDVKQLAQENTSLKTQITDLQEENNQMALEQKKLERYQELYDTDQSYTDYDKVAAEVIAKDPGNWYSTFTIDRGSKDGIAVDMNVLATGGLAGIVTEVGPNWATVRTIIDDGCNVSGMTIADSDTCIVTGNLELMDSGKVQFSQLTDSTGSVAAGEKIVTSNISEKYLEGILIGTISSIETDANNLTCTGYLVPAVDFKHIREVLVITQLKTTDKESGDEE